MFWIATICLLAVISWILFDAVNERRWVEAHQDDESVAADKGLAPKYSQLSRSPMPERRYSINKQDSSVGRFATNMREKTFNLGKVIEQKTTEKFRDTADVASADGMKAGGRSWSEIGNSIVGDNSMIGRATEKISKKAVEIGAQLPTEMLKPALRDKSAPAVEPTGPVGRFVKNVSSRVEQIERKLDAKV